MINVRSSNQFHRRKRYSLKYYAVMVTLSNDLVSSPLSECAIQSVNLILSKRHSTIHPHGNTLFSLLSFVMQSHLLLLLLFAVEDHNHSYCYFKRWQAFLLHINHFNKL